MPRRFHPRPLRRVAMRLLTGLALLLADAAVLAMQPAQPLPDTAVVALLSRPEYEIFALQAALPRIGTPSLALLARASLAAARLDAAEARRLVDRVLAGHPHDPKLRALAWATAAEAAFAAGDYAAAAKAARQEGLALAATGGDLEERANAAQTGAMAARLAAALPQRVASYRPQAVPVHADKVGLPRATAVIDGVAQGAVLDTGANLSVVSLSTARRLGLHMQQGGASVDSASKSAVAVRLGVADTLVFAGLSLHNVAFLVLDDRQLAMPVPGGYRIDAILGYPVLRELQRFRITAAGRLEPALSPAAPADAAVGNLRMVGNDLYVQAEVGGKAVAMHLDSGAAASSLSSAFASRHAELLQGLQQRRQHVAGAGGAMVSHALVWPDAHMRVAGRGTVLATLAVEPAGNGGSPSLLGEDVLHGFDWWSVDFGRMRFELGPPKRPLPPVNPVVGPGRAH